MPRNVSLDDTKHVYDNKEINEKILFSLTKLIKLPDTPTKTKHANDNVNGVIILIFYNKFFIYLTIISIIL